MYLFLNLCLFWVMFRVFFFRYVFMGGFEGIVVFFLVFIVGGVFCILVVVWFIIYCIMFSFSRGKGRGIRCR